MNEVTEAHLQQFLERELSKIRRTYIDSPERILMDYNVEIEKMKDYSGRQLLEMLQNADDEAEPAEDKVAYLALTDHDLIVANNGNPFSEEGLRSLLYSHVSPKVMKQNTIGHKGTGFRSILSWTERVHIRSRGLSVEFSRESAIAWLQALRENHPAIRDFLQNRTDEPYPIATLLAPQWKPDAHTDLTQYDTYIILTVDQESRADIQRQIDALDMEVLLFLQHLNRIVIRSPNRNVTFTKTVQADGRIQITAADNGTPVRQQTWTVRGREGTFQDKNYEVKIAFSDALSTRNHLLYSYFKTNVRLPFPALCHGTFELTGNRNQLVVSSANAHVLDELIQLMVDTALEMTSRSETVSWDALKLLTFGDITDQNLLEMNFEQKVLEQVKNSALFPTVGNQYISYAEEPVFYQHPYSDFLRAAEFPNLTVCTKDKAITEFLEGQHLTYTYNAENFFRRLTDTSVHWTIAERAMCIRYLLDDYNEHLKDPHDRQLLNLFLDQEGAAVSPEDELFLPPEGGELQLPPHINIRFMHAGLYQALLRACDARGARALAFSLRHFDVKEYSFETVLRRAVTRTRELAATDRQNKKRYVSDLLNFLYDVFRGETNVSIPAGVDIPLLNRFRRLTNVRNLYFGKEYEATIMEHLLGPVDANLFVGSPTTIGLPYDREDVKRFLKWLGIAEWPRFRLTELINETDYEKSVFQHVAYPIKLGEDPFGSFDALWNARSWSSRMVVETVDRLPDILAHAPTEAIVGWVLKDPHAHQLVFDGREIHPDAKVLISLRKKQQYRRLSTENIQSYFLWTLQHSPWIRNLHGQKVNAEHCCTSKVIGQEFSPLIEVPVCDMEQAPLVSTDISSSEVDLLFTKLGIGSDLKNFSTEVLYDILLNLPQIDPAGVLARSIYKQVIIARPKVDESSSTYHRFLKTGQVLVARDGVKGYIPVSDAYYVEDRTWCEEIMKQFPVLDVERRSGNRLVKHYLGVKPLDGIHFKLLDEPSLHPLNHDFQRDWEEFKPFVYAFRIDHDSKRQELRLLQNLQVSLCTTLNADYVFAGQQFPFTVHDYEYVTTRKGSQAFLKVPTESMERLSDLRGNFRFRKAIADLVAGTLKVEDHQQDYRELYGQKLHDREDLLRQELNDDELSALRKAQDLLGMTTDPVKTFWNAVMRGTKNPAVDPGSEGQFIEVVASTLGLAASYLRDVWHQIDYDDPGSEDSAPSIIELFQKVRLDVERYNVYGRAEVDLTEYYRTAIDDLKKACRGPLRTFLFNDLASAPMTDQQQFRARWDEYDMWMDVVPNSVNYDCRTAFDAFLATHFHTSMRELQNIQIVDLQELYVQNRGRFYEQVASMGITDVWLDVFLESSRNVSLVYFGKTDELRGKYQELVQQKSRGLSNGPPPENGNNDHGPTPNRFATIFSGMKWDGGHYPIETIKPHQWVKESHRTSSSPPSGRRNPRPNQAVLEEHGFLGEAHVYLALCDQYGEENVEWVSEYARKAEVNESGNDSEHHDIRYTNRRGQLKYVEVKATAGLAAVFEISKEEVAFGEDKKDAYELFLVLDVSEEPRIQRIPGFFKYKRDESFTQNPRFSVENRRFTVRFRPAT